MKKSLMKNFIFCAVTLTKILLFLMKEMSPMSYSSISIYWDKFQVGSKNRIIYLILQ